MAVKTRTCGRHVFAAMLLVSLLYVAGCSGSLPKQDNSDTGEAASATSEETTAEDVQPSTDEPLLDFSDAVDREKVTRFVSIFTIGDFWFGEPVVVSQMTSEELARCAVRYVYQNANDLCERPDADAMFDYYSLPGEGGGALDRYNARIDADVLTTAALDLFGREIDFDEISGSYDGPYHYHGGYVYFGTTAPPREPDGIACITSMEYLGNGEYSVAFDTYRQTWMNLDIINDSTLYTSTASELMERFGASGPYKRGEAVVHCDADGRLSLVRYETQPL